MLIAGSPQVQDHGDLVRIAGDPHEEEEGIKKGQGVWLTDGGPKFWIRLFQRFLSSF